MIFDRIVCGVDASEESLEAARQAARLCADGGRLVLVAVSEIDVAVQAGWAATAVIDELRHESEQALERGRAAAASVPNVETRLLEGPAAAALREELARADATLLALGSHEHGRVAGFLIGSLTTTLLHDADCAVLVARPPVDPDAFPSSVVVGLDGSAESERAWAVAAELERRFGSSVRSLVAAGGKEVDPEAVQERHPQAEAVAGKPVDELVDASTGTDLVIVGSRGLHGLRALGSVGERVAHDARCSVLVVR